MICLRRYIVYMLVTLMLSTPFGVMSSPREDAIKSGFMYNFARYSEGKWFNASLMKSYNICSYEEQFVQIARQTLKDRTIKKLPVSILLINSEFANIDHCHTLFISKDDIDKWSYLSTYKSITSIMLVGEIDDFILNGGHINFFSVGGKIRFEVNPDKLKQSGIQMSSKVLRLGRTNKAER